MKFLMLLRKELRESLPWILLAAIALLIIGGLALRLEVRLLRSAWSYSNLSPGTTANTYWFCQFSS